MAFFTTVRYGKMSLVARCRMERDDIRQRDGCIVRTDRGKEYGTVLSPPEPIPESMAKESLFDIIRKASTADSETAGRIDKENRVNAMKYCREQIVTLKLAMKIVEVDFLFSGDRIIIYFMADSRVDFRHLVRILAREFRTRVDLRQVGARDEARLVGDAGHCGLKLCCRGFLKELGGITMDMAKIQKHTSDPSKITGRCGKLLCCLRYEYNAYREGRDLMPPRGKMLTTRMGEGKVVDRNLLLREVTIEAEGGERHVVKLDELSEVRAETVSGCNGCDEPKGGTKEKGDAGRPVATSQPEDRPDMEVRRKLEEETTTRKPEETTTRKPEERAPVQNEEKKRRRSRRRGRRNRRDGN